MHIVMLLAKKLLHTRYRVNDLEKTVEFYKNVLGLEEVRRHKSPRGSELAFLKAPESEETVEICHFPNSGPVVVQEDLTHLAFEVDSLEEFGRHLAKLGFEYSDGPTMREAGGGFAFIDAPEGYEIELMPRTLVIDKKEFPWITPASQVTLQSSTDRTGAGLSQKP